MQDNLAIMFDGRIGQLEQMQEQRAQGYQLLLEGYEATARETSKLFEAKVYDYIDRQTLDSMQKTQRLVHDQVGAQRKDSETMIVRLGNNIQNALQKVQQQMTADIEFYQNDAAQKSIRLKNDIIQRNNEQMEEQVQAV